MSKQLVNVKGKDFQKVEGNEDDGKDNDVKEVNPLSQLTTL